MTIKNSDLMVAQHAAFSEDQLMRNKKSSMYDDSPNNLPDVEDPILQVPTGA